MHWADHKATDEYAWFSRAVSLRGVFLSSGASEEWRPFCNSYYDSSMKCADHKATDEYAWFLRAISLRGVFLSSGASEEGRPCL